MPHEKLIEVIDHGTRIRTYEGRSNLLRNDDCAEMFAGLILAAIAIHTLDSMDWIALDPSRENLELNPRDICSF